MQPYYRPTNIPHQQQSKSSFSTPVPSLKSIKVTIKSFGKRNKVLCLERSLERKGVL